MPSVDSQARTQSQQHDPTLRDILNLQQPQSTESEPSDTSTVTSQTPDSNNTTQLSRYDIVRNDDRQRHKAGEHPGPNWKNAEAMKAWLEQRFPQGTKAGSPYYQFMIVASRFEDTYWTPGRGSAEVVSKFSESEWQRWSKERAGLVMHSKSGPESGQNPLYPDANTAMSLAAFAHTARSRPSSQPSTQKNHSSSRPSSQPSTQQNHSQMADVDRFLGGIKLPAFLSRVEKHLDKNPYDLGDNHRSSKRTVDDAELDAQQPSAYKKYKSARNAAKLSQMMQSIPENVTHNHSSSKRTVDDAELNAQEPSAWKKHKSSQDLAKLSQMMQSIPEKDSSSKKRTAGDAEIDAGESPYAKRVERFSGITSPFQTANPNLNSRNTRRDRTIKHFRHAPRSTTSPPKGSFGNHDDVVAEYIQRSMLRGQQEEEVEEAEEAEKVGHDSLSSFKSFGNHDDVVAEYIQRSMLRGQQEEAEVEETEEAEEKDEEETEEEAEGAEEAEKVGHDSLSGFRSFGNHDDVVAEYIQRSMLIGQQKDEEVEVEEAEHHGKGAILANITPSLTQNTPQTTQPSTSTAPHATTSQPPSQHLIDILIPAPPAPPITPPNPIKKRLPTSTPPPTQTSYYLRSSIKKRRHTLPCFVHLGWKGRKEIEIAGCLGF